MDDVERFFEIHHLSSTWSSISDSMVTFSIPNCPLHFAAVVLAQKSASARFYEHEITVGLVKAYDEATPFPVSG